MPVLPVFVVGRVERYFLQREGNFDEAYVVEGHVCQL
jgi:hypothetical protein